MGISIENWLLIIGIVGAVLLLLAYVLVSKKKVDGGSRFYHILNIVGAAMLAVHTAVTGAWPAMTLNVVWVMIGIGTIGKLAAEKKRGDQAIASSKHSELK